jgi:diguanylate cyclase (GGDEF)-like protein
LSLLLIDADFFKPYNDNYGHLAGDQCLRLLGDILKGALRRGDDIAARYGGEEFVILLPNTDTQGALEVADRVNAALNHAKLRHEYSMVSSQVTCSMGLSCLVPNHDGDSSHLVLKADVALYKAKSQGRNQVVVAPRGE